MTNEVMPHHGQNIKRFRELLGIKQENLAAKLGEDWTQKKISQLEGKEAIEPELLDRVAKALNVPAEALKNFDEETAITNIQNNYDSAVMNGTNLAYKCTINPIDKWVEAIEENKKLYERLLESEKYL